MDIDPEIEGLRSELEKKGSELETLRAGLAKRDAELAQMRESLAELAETRRANLFMLEDLNDSFAAIEKAKREWTATFDAISDPPLYS